MRDGRQTFALTFPVGVSSQAALSALGGWYGLGTHVELVSEVVGDAMGIRHLLHVPEEVAASAIDQMAAALPGIRVDSVEARSTGSVVAAARIAVSMRALLRTDASDVASRSLLQGMASLKDDERVSIRWALRPSAAPAGRGDRPGASASLRVRAEERAWRARLDQPGFICTGLVIARADDVTRARQLVSHVVAVLRSRRGVGAGLTVRRGSVRSQSVMPRTGRCRGWLTSSELLPVLGWPLGTEMVPGVALGAARRIPVPREVPAEGRRLFLGIDAYGDRPVALTAIAARHHLAIVGPSGVGKSALLARCILSDIEAGFGGVVIDPKADLITDLLDRVPAKDAERIVVLDPATSGPVPGLNLLSVGDPDLRADVVLGALGAIFKDAWGIRTDTYLRLGLRTLAEAQNPVLTDWLRLFSDPSFRRRAVADLSDPLLVAAWQGYEALSPQEQNQHIAAPMSKVIALLSRPSVRGVLAQETPKLDIGGLLAQRKWLFVSLSPGVLGEPAARLLGAVLTYAVWSAVEARASVPVDKRKTVLLYLDELQSLSTLPFGLEYFFERARGLGCGVTVATQALGRLPERLRQSLIGNAGSLVSFRLGYTEASRVARELPGLGPQDLQALRRFEVAARISTGLGSGVAVMTGRTEPLPSVTGQADRIRVLSADAYGQEVVSIGEELRHREDAAGADDAPVGRRRRAS